MNNLNSVALNLSNSFRKRGFLINKYFNAVPNKAFKNLLHNYSLKRVLAKNERGYRRIAKNKCF